MELAERLINIKEVCKIMACSKSTIYNDVNSGAFPKPRAFGGRSRWLYSEVMDHIKNAPSTSLEPPLALAA